MINNKGRTMIAALLVIICWAYSPIGIRIGLQSYMPGQLALARFIVASLFMLITACLKGVARPRLVDIPLFILLGFFAVTLHHIALNMGQPAVSAGASSVLAQSTPIFTLLIARLYLKEQVSLWRWVCVITALIGAVVVIQGDHHTPFDGINSGALLILLAALSWSIYFTLQKHFSNRYSLLTMSCYTVWLGTLILTFYTPGLVAQATAASLQVNIAVVVLGIFPSALAYLWWAYVLERMPISQSVPLLYFVPPVSMVMANWLLEEQTSFLVVLGSAIIIASMLAMHYEGLIKLKGRK